MGMTNANILGVGYSRRLQYPFETLSPCFLSRGSLRTEREEIQMSDRCGFGPHSQSVALTFHFNGVHSGVVN
jgi:hypothetical protein